MKLSCGMIVRDCSDTLEVALQSVKPHVDELCIVDTGSTDETPQIARRYADKFEVFLGCNDLQSGLINDFAMARNKSMDLCTGDAFLWVDADDLLVGGENLKAALEHAKEENVVLMLQYEYSHDAQGRCTCIHWRERVLKPPRSFHWESPVHEVCVPYGPIQGSFTTLRSEVTRVIHRAAARTKPKEQGRNLRILKQHIARVHEGDIRSLYYIGLEYAYIGDFGSAIRYLERYTELSQWYDERCLAMLELARIYNAIGDLRAAKDWSLEATTVRFWPEPYWRLGRIFYSYARANEAPEYNYRRAATFFQLGLAVGENDTVLFVNPQEKYQVHEFLNVCLAGLGDVNGAIASCKAGLEGLPGYEPLLNNLALYTAHAAQNDQVGQAPAPSSKEVQLLQKLEPAAPAHRLPEPGKLDLVFLIGHQVEPWNPTTVQTSGIGGSETMAMHLARLLASRGHAVRLYGQCTPAMEGIFENVEYLDATRFRDVTCDVMISSRKPSAVDDEHKLRSKANVLWLHDIHVGHELNFVRDVRFDRIFALSPWHKEFLCMCYPRTNPDKIVVTRNGIDPQRFEGIEERDPHRVVYSSSPDRGLGALLEMWPDIIARVPDATLHVYYGFLNWRAASHAAGNEAQLREIAHLEHLSRTMPSVIFHDRINQNELAREFMRSGIWAYPTWFTETNCITAAEAQAAGLHIVTSKLAALQTTVADRGVLLDWERVAGDMNRLPLPDYRAQFIEHMTRFMLHPDEAERQRVREYALEHFALEPLADEWERMLMGLVAEMTERVVPQFYDAAVAA